MARVAFCQDSFVEYMSFMTMSAVLKAHGHVVKVFIHGSGGDDAFVAEVARFRPDVVGFSLLTPGVDWALRVVSAIKSALDPVIILGGVHILLDPGLIEEPGVDVLCIGEGEAPLLELASRLDRSQSYRDIPSLVVKTAEGVFRNPVGPLVDLERLPFVDRDLYDTYRFFRESSFITVSVGRGCPYSCRFCSNPFLKRYYGAGYIRKMSPARAVAEIRHQVEKRHPRYVVIIDEVLWVKNDWLEEFLIRYRREVGVKFIANLRWGPIEERHVRLLAEAGAHRLTAATESGDEAQRMEKMGKHLSDREIFRTAALLRKYGIGFGASVFFGVPGDRVADHLQRLAFFRKLRATYVWTTFLQPYRGTALRHDSDVAAHMRRGKAFGVTSHHDMYLDLPDARRLSNLKKIYFLLVRFPWAQKALMPMIGWHLSLVNDALFFLHFTYYAFSFEKISVRQYWYHVKTFGIAPLLRSLRRAKQRPSSAS